MKTKVWFDHFGISGSLYPYNTNEYNNLNNTINGLNGFLSHHSHKNCLLWTIWLLTLWLNGEERFFRNWFGDCVKLRSRNLVLIVKDEKLQVWYSFPDGLLFEVNGHVEDYQDAFSRILSEHKNQ